MVAGTRSSIRPHWKDCHHRRFILLRGCRRRIQVVYMQVCMTNCWWGCHYRILPLDRWFHHRRFPRLYMLHFGRNCHISRFNFYYRHRIARSCWDVRSHRHRVPCWECIDYCINLFLLCCHRRITIPASYHVFHCHSSLPRDPGSVLGVGWGRTLKKEWGFWSMNNGRVFACGLLFFVFC